MCTAISTPPNCSDRKQRKLNRHFRDGFPLTTAISGLHDSTLLGSFAKPIPDTPSPCLDRRRTASLSSAGSKVGLWPNVNTGRLRQRIRQRVCSGGATHRHVEWRRPSPSPVVRLLVKSASSDQETSVSWRGCSIRSRGGKENGPSRHNMASRF